MAGGTAVAQGLSILTAPITSRLYAPADYGMAAVFSSVVGVILLPSTMRYEMALMLPPDEEDACSILWACFTLCACASLLTIVATLLFGERLFRALGAPGLYHYWWMLPPTILGGGLYQCLAVWSLRRKAYMTLTGTKLRQALIGSIVTIGVGFFWKGPVGLLLGSVCWMTMGVGRLGQGTLSRGKGLGFAVVAKRIKDALRCHWRFGVVTTAATLLNNAGTLVAPMLFSACYTPTIVGHFSLAQRIVTLPGTLVGMAVAQVFIAEAAEMIRERPGDLPHFFNKVTRKMAPFALGVVLLGASCPWVFPIAFGARWQLAGQFAVILSAMAAIQLVVSPIADISVLRQRLALQFSLGSLRMLMVFATIWLPSHLGFGPIVAVGCYVSGMSLIFGIAYMFYARIARDGKSLAPAEPLPAAA
jgi:O-antigen/teichoic acid export membrane protein